MIQRFETRENLVAAILQQQIVAHDKTVAGKLAEVAKLVQFEIAPPNNVLITQDASDNDLLLILAGEVAIWVNGREMAFRKAGQHVGEMAIIDISARRSATVIATKQTVAAKIEEKDFTPIADKHPTLWRQVALALGNRLRERGKYVTHPNPRPVVFIGSSKESLNVAREIQALFAHDNLVPRPWTDGFRPSATNIENLEREQKGADFAILVLAADDVIESREAAQHAPRDNVVWEHGFFTGGLGRERVFIVMPRHQDLKLPSDWAGLTVLDYDPRGNQYDLSSRLGPSVISIRKEIIRLGTK
jgi:CRP/FNR family transcriptional regulator, cyclic AMP receptor protein